MAVRNTPPSSTFEEWRQETNEIATDAGDVSTLNTTATNLTGAVNEHEVDITTNATDITTNTSNITTNTSNITTNTSGISTNTSGISTNTSDITTNTTAITTKEDIGVATAMAIALGG